MKIIVVNDYGFINGGTAQVAISSLNLLADAGLDVTFVSGVLPIDKTINTKKVHVINFGLNDLISNPNKTQSAISGIWNYRSARLFGELLDVHKTDTTVIHIHGWSKSLSASIARMAIGRGYKVIVTMHDYFTVCPNGGLYNYQTQTHCNLVPMSFSCCMENCDSRSYSHKCWRVGRQFIQNSFAGIPLGINYFISEIL
jgi:hypothetical protein